jgi:hypothetical protein
MGFPKVGLGGGKQGGQAKGQGVGGKGSGGVMVKLWWGISPKRQWFG